MEQRCRRASIPGPEPNEAMFEAALAQGGRLGLLATFAPSIPSMAAEFEEMRDKLGSAAELVSHVVPEAMRSLRGGDVEAHNRLVAEGANRSEEHTSELQSLMRITYAVICLKK